MACDAVIIDLEDGVLPADKAKARASALRALQEMSFGSRERLVRINAIASVWGIDDIAAFAEAPVKPDTVVIPKVADPDSLLAVARALAGTSVGFLPQIETARGLLAAAAIATCHPAVNGLFFGAGDLLVETGGRLSAQTLLYPRSLLAVAAAAAGIIAIDTPFFRLRDHAGLEADARAAAELGFAGKAVIHPEQIPIVNRIFTPSPERVKWAEQVVSGATTQHAGVWIVDEEMVDAMTVRLAQRVLAIAQARSSSES